jgi:hypothetical protein
MMHKQLTLTFTSGSSADGGVNVLSISTEEATVKKTLWFANAFIGLALVASISGCSDDGDDDPVDPGQDNLFVGYRDWLQVDHSNAPLPLLGGAHEAADPEYARAVYTTAPAMLVDGTYPVGTVFVKETFTFAEDGTLVVADPMGLLGMVKREAGFDAAGSNWEYYVIDPADLSTLDSGADLVMCKSCHAVGVGSAGTDRIFDHPGEFVASTDDFAGYASWHVIGLSQGPDDLLGPAHEGNDANAVRTVYKKQLAANPNGLGNGYPTGTLILKTVHDSQDNLIGMTGMAKRGAAFDPDNHDWEYFMWDVGSGQIADRGAIAMCIGCHSAANSGGRGTDFVFAHPEDPFNN